MDDKGMGLGDIPRSDLEELERRLASPEFQAAFAAMGAKLEAVNGSLVQAILNLRGEILDAMEARAHHLESALKAYEARLEKARKALESGAVGRLMVVDEASGLDRAVGVITSIEMSGTVNIHDVLEGDRLDDFLGSRTVNGAMRVLSQDAEALAALAKPLAPFHGAPEQPRNRAERRAAASPKGRFRKEGTFHPGSRAHRPPHLERG